MPQEPADGLTWLDQLACICAPQDKPNPECPAHGYAYAKLRKVRYGWTVELCPGRGLGFEIRKTAWRRTYQGAERVGKRWCDREERRRAKAARRYEPADHIVTVRTGR